MSGLLGKISASLGRASPSSSLDSRSRTSSDGSVTTPPGRPSSPEVESNIGILLTIVDIPRQYVDGVVIKLREILSKPDHRPYDQILSRASHPCVQEYLRGVFSLLDSQQAAVQNASREFRGADLQDFMDSASRQKEAYYSSIAELLGKGFDEVLKVNLIKDADGNPIGVREKDRTRFPTCHKTLSGTGGKRRRQTKKKVIKRKKTSRRVRH